MFIALLMRTKFISRVASIVSYNKCSSHFWQNCLPENLLTPASLNEALWKTKINLVSISLQLSKRKWLTQIRQLLNKY
jgi:hypothetical protein